MVDLSALFSSLSESTLRLCRMPLPATPSVPRSPPRKLQHQLRLTDDQVKLLIAQHEAGHSVRKLTTEFSINRETVLEHLKRAGVSRRANVRKLNDQQVQEAGQMYEVGLSLIAVGERFGVDAGTIRHEFIRASIPVRPRRGWIT